MMNKYIVKSNAKVSVYSNIVGVNNGIWNIETLIFPIDLFDIIEIKLSNNYKINVQYTDTNNTIKTSEKCINAVKKIMEYCNEFQGVDILIHKKIPISSGLGGESSNMVTILYVMNTLLKTDISVEKLMNICYQAGNDTYFFSYNQPICMISKRIYPFPIESKNFPFLCMIIDPNIHFVDSKTKYILSKKFNLSNKKIDLKRYFEIWTNKDLSEINNSLMSFITKDTIPEYNKAFIISDDIYNLCGFRPVFTGSGPFMILFVDKNLKQLLSSYCKQNNIKFYFTKLL